MGDGLSKMVGGGRLAPTQVGGWPQHRWEVGPNTGGRLKRGFLNLLTNTVSLHRWLLNLSPFNVSVSC